MLYNDVEKWSYTLPVALSSVTYSDVFCTFEINNNSGGALKAKAYTEGGSFVATHIHSNAVDNAYLIDVTRGTPGSPGRVDWKYWNQDGTAFNMLYHHCTGSGHLNTGVSNWECSTQGGGTDTEPDPDVTGYCTGPGSGSPRQWCSHDTDYPNHESPNQCMDGDTPPFTGTGRGLPTITGKVDYGCNSLFGTAKVQMCESGGATGDCGCSRSYIRLHGDQVSGSCPDDQALVLSCISPHNYV